MYSLSVPSAQWYAVQQYLSHNYWCYREHYTFHRTDSGVELVCLKSDLYELVRARFNLA